MSNAGATAARRAPGTANGTRTPPTTKGGSDGSAAGGGKSDLSEWQRSIKSRKSESPKILSGTATGKLVGAVTHVLVNDPTTGYGIFAETMLETAQSVSEQQLKEAS